MEMVILENRMDLALAIDVGGTKCDMLLADARGNILRRGRGSVSDGEQGRGAGRSEPAILDALRQVLEGVNFSGVLGVGHNGSEYILPILERALPSGSDIRLCTEADMAFAIAGALSGVVVCSGTGAFVHGRRSDGRRLHVDGVGPLLGDYGSAYQVGMQALRAAYRSSWHERHGTRLAGAVYRFSGGRSDGPSDPWHLDCEERQYLSGYQRGGGRSEIASLAPLVDIEAERGDATARAILEKASQDLGENLRDVIDALELADGDWPLIATGGNLLRSSMIWNGLCAIARKLAPGSTPFRISTPLSLGGVLCLLAPVGVNHGAGAIRERLFRSIHEFAPEFSLPEADDSSDPSLSKNLDMLLSQ